MLIAGADREQGPGADAVVLDADVHLQRVGRVGDARDLGTSRYTETPTEYVQFKL